jgi:hypothetical protein
VYTLCRLVRICFQGGIPSSSPTLLWVVVVMFGPFIGCRMSEHVYKGPSKFKNYGQAMFHKLTQEQGVLTNAAVLGNDTKELQDMAEFVDRKSSLGRGKPLLHSPYLDAREAAPAVRAGSGDRRSLGDDFDQCLISGSEHDLDETMDHAEDGSDDEPMVAALIAPMTLSSQPATHLAKSVCGSGSPCKCNGAPAKIHGICSESDMYGILCMWLRFYCRIDATR